MTATAHAIVGGAIAVSVKDPALGLSLAAISHPILDLIPHWDFGWGWKKKTKIKLLLESAFDLSLGIVLAYLIFGRLITNQTYFFLAILASEVWDILESPYWFFDWHFPPFSWIYKVQSSMQGKAKLPWGILNQVITVVGVILFLKIF